MLPITVPSSSPNPPGDPGLSGRLPVLLRHAWYGLNQAFRRRLVHLELTPDQYTVLRTLSENEGISQKDLTQLMASDPNTIASLLERMESSGLVERKRCIQDRRIRSLTVRPEGRRKFEAAHGVASRLLAEVLKDLPASEHGSFLEQLGVIAAACQGASHSSKPRLKQLQENGIIDA